MVGTDLPTFECELLDQMHSGTVYLSVPTRGDAIQIGARGETRTATIRICRQGDAVTITRVDGRPLQVAVHVDAASAMVFHRPPVELRLRSCCDAVGVGRWYAVAAPSDITDHRHLQQLARTVGAFASAKQRRVHMK